MKLKCVMVTVAMLVANPLASQSLQPVADGVYVLSLPAAAGARPQNIGVVEFGAYLLVIDACDGESWRTLTELLRERTDKPIRFLATTRIPPNGCDFEPAGVTRLVENGASGSGIYPDGGSYSGNLVLSDNGVRVILRNARTSGVGGGWTIHVSGANVLFAGDFVGQPRGSDPAAFDDWVSELRRLEWLTPTLVVPASGPTGGINMLQETRGALVRAKATITDMVDGGRAREQVIGQVVEVVRGILPAGTVEHLYDEHIGVLPATAFVEGLGLREGPSQTAETPGWTAPRKVVVADLWPGRTGQLALAAPGVEVVVARDRDHAAELIDDADAILGWVTPEILARGARLRWVALLSAGVESYLELPGFAESDVVLTNGQRLYAYGGAEHVLGMILALSRRLNTAVRLQGERIWDTAPLTGPTPITGDGSELGELRGKTLLVAGLGGIGTEVARLAHGLGMRVIATRASRREGPLFVDYVGLSDELVALGGEADVIVNCLPLTSETEGIFGEEFFSVAKPTAYFVNIGRGKTVDTNALVRSLRESRIAGAGLDVTEPEPLPAAHELWGMPNVIITPHVGGDSERHMERIWLLFRENLRRFALGEPLLSVVDKRRGY